ncbi:glycosyltransferase [Patescibacteria group bacterium]|nr:MAG: glycosyltransferase [Patescibacteria group bacterium]
MKVSVLMSVYNGERFIREAVVSLLGQTFRDFELLIVDDGSSDATPQILEELTAQDTRCRVITNPTNIGLTKSLNIALRQAQGDYVARMDTDDVALPQRLEKQVLFLDTHQEVGIVGTAYQFIDNAGNVIGETSPPIADQDLRRVLIRANPFLHSSVIIRKTVLDRVQGYNETFRRAQDYDLWMRLSLLTKLANLPDILMQKRFTTGMISFRKEREQIRFALRVRWNALRRRQFPWWTTVFLIKPFLATILPSSFVRFVRIYIYQQDMYRNPT